MISKTKDRHESVGHLVAELSGGEIRASTTEEEFEETGLLLSNDVAPAASASQELVSPNDLTFGVEAADVGGRGVADGHKSTVSAIECQKPLVTFEPSLSLSEKLVLYALPREADNPLALDVAEGAMPKEKLD